MKTLDFECQPRRYPSHLSNEYLCVFYQITEQWLWHWKTTWGKISDGTLKIDWVSKDGIRYGSRMEPRYHIEWKGGCFTIIPNWFACGSRNEECWSCGVPLTAKDSYKERLDWIGMKDPEDFLRWRGFFGIDGGLGSLIPRVSELGSWRGKR
jgi:hypothetical protein